MNYLTISFWILTIIWIALLLISLHKMSPKGNIKARDITFHALIIALIVVMGFVPEAGYIYLFCLALIIRVGKAESSTASPLVLPLGFKA